MSLDVDHLLPQIDLQQNTSTGTSRTGLEVRTEEYEQRGDETYLQRVDETTARPKTPLPPGVLPDGRSSPNEPVPIGYRIFGDPAALIEAIIRSHDHRNSFPEKKPYAGMMEKRD